MGSEWDNEWEDYDLWQDCEPVAVERPVASHTSTNSRHLRRGFPKRGRGDDRHNDHANSTSSSNTTCRSNNEDVNVKKVNISEPACKVGRIIACGSAKIRELEATTSASINIGEELNGVTEVIIKGDDNTVKHAQELIENIVADNTRYGKYHSSNRPEQKQHNYKDFVKVSDDGVEWIHWFNLNKCFDEEQRDRWSKLPPIVKDFYKEDPEVAAMPEREVARWRLANNDIQVKRTFDEKDGLRKLPNPVLTFEQGFKHFPEILQEIYKQKFEKPSPIQSQAWPVLMRGDDLIGIAQTGTGKTLAFLLPALIHIDLQVIPRSERDGPTVLIMAPTRELALQIEKEVRKYQYRGIKSVCIYGGRPDRNKQIKRVTKGVDIVIATPGRLNSLIDTGHLNITSFSYIVLDEADRMLDLGFEPQIRRSLFDVRPDRQTVMTSATWPEEVRRLAQSYMKDPIQVNVGSLDLAAVHTVTQKLAFVEKRDKEAMLMEFLSGMDPNDKVIVFCSKKIVTKHIFEVLCLKGVNCQSIHSDRRQSEREAAMEDMRDGTVNILIATDVACRGIDICDITHVVNFDFPHKLEEYVHRVGRTGRAGRTGTSLSFITRNNWRHARELIRILEEANQEVPDELEQVAQQFEAKKPRRGSLGGRGGAGTTGTSLSFIANNDWRHARKLIRILKEANQEVPDELEHVVKQFEVKKLPWGGRGERRGGGRGRRR